MNSRDEVVMKQAELLLRKLYLIWRKSFTFATVDDILFKATDEEISYYSHWLCEGGNK